MAKLILTYYFALFMIRFLEDLQLGDLSVKNTNLNPK